MTASLFRHIGFALIALGLLLPHAASAQVPTQQELSRLAPLGAYLAGRQALIGRDFTAAAAYYRAALRADPNNKELLESTLVALLVGGDVDEAAKLAEKAVQSDKSHRLARLTLGVRALKQKQYQTARQHFSLTGQRVDFDLIAGLLSGWASYGAGDTRAAVDTIDKLTGPEQLFPLFKNLHAGLILELAGGKKEAGKRFEKAYSLDPNDMRVVESYAGWAMRNGSKDDALKVVDAFRKAAPRNPFINALSDTIKRGEKPALLFPSPQDGAAEVLFGVSSWLSRKGSDDLGPISLQLALYLQPSHPLALLALADLYTAVKKPELAIKLYERIPATSPMRRSASIQMAVELDGLERSDEARKILDKLIVEQPKDVDAYYALAALLRSRKKYEECTDVYNKIVPTIENPQKSDWVVFYYRGICQERSRQWDKAEADLKKALELFPEQPQVLNYLGYSWVDQGVNLDEGMKMIRRAVDQKPDDGYIIDSLGWAYYRLGRYDEAVEQLEKAVSQKPEDPTINDHLGDAYWKVGREPEARFQWSHAKDLKPEPEELPKIEEKLKSGLSDAPSPAADAERIKKSGSGG